ncbi:MAG TPA: hypothetical protein DCM87_21275 [Planctomycetes bacterium]|nr:hypothetical protein [Planctomycetota bacterium]
MPIVLELVVLAAARDAFVLQLDAAPRDGAGAAFAVPLDAGPIDGFPGGWRLVGPDGAAIAFQYDAPLAGEAAGTLTCARAPAGNRLRIERGAPPADAALRAVTVVEDDAGVRIDNGVAEVFYARAEGGLPARIRFAAAGRTFEGFHLNDRVYEAGRGGFLVREDREGRMRVLARGPYRAAIEIEARYGGARNAPGAPRVRYVFEHLAGSPAIRVTADIVQTEAAGWSELHVLEINFPHEFFTRWEAGDPVRAGALAGGGSSVHASSWGALIGEGVRLGIFGTPAIVHDGRGGYGTYLHGPWTRLDGTSARRECVLWAGPDSAEDFARDRAAPLVEAVLTRPDLIAREEALRKREPFIAHALEALVASRPLPARERAIALLEALPAGSAALPPQTGMWGTSAGGTSVFVDRATGALAGVWFGGRRLARPHRGGFALTLRGKAGTRTVTAEDGTLGMECAAQDDRIVVRGRAPDGLAAALTIERGDDGVLASFAVEALPPGESVVEVAFPSLALGAPGAADAVLLYPQVSGRLARAPFDRAFAIQGTYPSGWWPMQFCALYDARGALYAAVEDPSAATKDLAFNGLGNAVLFESRWPAPDAGKPGNVFALPGRVRLMGYAGDWFDAARSYRQWAAANAPWMRARARPSPAWIEDIAVWALASGTAEAVAGPVAEFARYAGVPAAVHWYNWHVIPFDTDYPHYFPAKDGFAAGVKDLQAHGVRVMPYINGRLWDTGLADFTGDVAAAATCDEKGAPFIEEYGSGRKLAPMCPVTPLWRAKVTEIVTRLLGPEYGLDAVYIDQIAAAGPRLCANAAHGHPLAGGSWWVGAGYRPMLERIRASIGPDRVLTTECNAEPYIDLFDAYLTWHFQYADSVPAFAAVYGGAIQLFGRAYRGGPTAALALRMKAGQSLVFGEQIGWIGPESVRDPENGPFLRRVARLRYHLRDFLAKGAMARPPRFREPLPQVTADWQWSGVWPVSGPAIESGAWRARDGRVACIFVNVTGERRAAVWDFAPAALDRADGPCAAAVVTEDGERAERATLAPGPAPIDLGPGEAFAYILPAR